jgi:RNA polymerase sigma-70 factor (ECF subfamily)
VSHLYRSLQPGLLRYVASREPREAEDVASQVWLEVARSLSRFEGLEQEFRAFVYTIARRRVSNARRTRARHPADLVPSETLSEGVAARNDPASEAAGNVDSDLAVRRIVGYLSPQQADVVLLRIVAGLPVDEVAAIVGKRPAAVRVIQHRALRRLALVLDDVGNGASAVGDLSR